jgi:hypothetical protein
MNIKALSQMKPIKTIQKLEKEVVESAYRRYDEPMGTEYLKKATKNADRYFNPRTQHEMQKPTNEVVGQNINFTF